MRKSYAIVINKKGNNLYYTIKRSLNTGCPIILSRSAAITWTDRSRNMGHPVIINSLCRDVKAERQSVWVACRWSRLQMPLKVKMYTYLSTGWAGVKGIINFVYFRWNLCIILELDDLMTSLNNFKMADRSVDEPVIAPNLDTMLGNLQVKISDNFWCSWFFLRSEIISCFFFAQIPSYFTARLPFCLLFFNFYVELIKHIK